MMQRGVSGDISGVKCRVVLEEELDQGCESVRGRAVDRVLAAFVADADGGWRFGGKEEFDYVAVVFRDGEEDGSLMMLAFKILDSVNGRTNLAGVV